MEPIDNINRLLGDDIKQVLKPGARLKVAASPVSMDAFEALKAELEQVGRRASGPTDQPRRLRDSARWPCHTVRRTSMPRIWLMANAGFNPFGHTSTQFRMERHRNRR